MVSEVREESMWSSREFIVKGVSSGVKGAYVFPNA